MKQLKDLIPDPANLLVLDEQQLGAEVLEVIASWEERPLYQLSREQFIGASLKDNVFGNGYHRDDLEEELAGAIGRAWDYLVRDGYLIPDRGYAPGVFKLGDRAKIFLSKPRDKRAIGNLKITKSYLHFDLQSGAWNNFRSAEYELAVFAAMKCVEVAVRNASGLPANLVGVNLMRKAFDPNGGPLSDAAAEGGEKQAMSDLFAGSIGSFKNPSSHRAVNFENPDTAAELIMLANHLLRIVEARKAVTP